MGYDVYIEGADRLQSLIGALDKEVKRAEVNAVNAMATLARKEIAQEIGSDTGISSTYVRRSMRISRGSQRLPVARVVPSSAGVPVNEYRYRARATSVPTRAQILVGFVGGEKVAAGFINPLSRHKLPLRSRSHKAKLPKPEIAYGPSIASAFKLLINDDKLSGYQARVAEIFEEKLALQMKGRIDGQ